MLLSNTMYEIVISKDNQFTLFSMDNTFYDNVIQLENYTRNDFVCAYNISVTSLMKDYMITIIGRAYGNIYSCAILEENSLVVLIDDHLVKINIFSGQIEWGIKIFEFGTGVEMYSFNNGYLVNSEVDIMYFNKDGQLRWTFSGRDIFVRPIDKSSIEILNNHILLTDFSGYKYQLDIHGMEI